MPLSPDDDRRAGDPLSGEPERGAGPGGPGGAPPPALPPRGPWWEWSDLDPGCEAVFAVLDVWAEAAARGEVEDEDWEALRAHLAACLDCRQDAEGLIAAVRRLATGG